MRRRPFLVGLLAMVAGCSGETTTTQNQDPQTTTTPEFQDSFENYLENVDVTVVSLKRSDNQVQMEYVPKGQQYEELSAEIGSISGGFLREVENGWEVSRLDAKIVSENGQRLARWHVLATWVEEYRNENITGEELSLKVINTLEYF